MASYHLRLKNDRKSNGQKVTAKGHVDYIFREEAKTHTEYTNREGSHKRWIVCLKRGATAEMGARVGTEIFWRSG